MEEYEGEESSKDKDEYRKDEIAHLAKKSQKHGSKRRKRRKGSLPKKTRNEKQSRVRSSAMSAKSLDI